MFETAAEPQPARHCFKCAHLLGRRFDLEQAPKWRCGHPSNVASESVDVVTGQGIKLYFHETCYAARELNALCGPLGTLWEAYNPPAYLPPPVSRGSRKVGALPSADDLLNELGVD